MGLAAATSGRLAQTGLGAAVGTPTDEPGQDTQFDLVDRFNVGIVDRPSADQIVVRTQ